MFSSVFSRQWSVSSQVQHAMFSVVQSTMVAFSDLKSKRRVKYSLMLEDGLVIFVP